MRPTTPHVAALTMDAQKNFLKSCAMEYRIATVLEVRCLRQPLRRLRTKGVIRLRSTRKSRKKQDQTTKSKTLDQIFKRMTLVSEGGN